MKKQGFTLIELLVYVAVLAIIMVSISSLFLWALRAHTKSQVIQETTWNAKRAMDVILQEVREATSIYTPTTSLTQLSLKTSKYLPDGETSSYVDFFLCDQRLCFKKESESPVALTSENVEITSFEVIEVATNEDFHSVRITLQVEYYNPNNRPEKISSVELMATASLRME